MNISFLLSILIFAGIMFIFFALYLFITARAEKSRILDKIDKTAAPAPLRLASNAATGGSAGGFQQFFIDLATRLGKYSTPNNEENLTHRKQKLIMADYRKANAPVIFYGLKIFFALVFPAALLLARMFFALPLQNTTLLMLVLSLALAGLYSPDAWVQFAIARRQEKITDGFPDALDLMVVCVEAGIGLDQAIKTVSDEMRLTNQTISEEFALMNLELRAGRSRQDAMRNLGARTGVEDVRNLVTLLIQTDRFGTSIAQALRVHSDSMRTKRHQRAEEKAMKLPVKMLFPLIFFIFPALFVAVIGPGAIKIYRSLIQTNMGAG